MYYKLLFFLKKAGRTTEEYFKVNIMKLSYQVLCLAICITRRTPMNMTAMKINTQEAPDITPLRHVEAAQNVDKQVNDKQVNDKQVNAGKNNVLAAKETENISVKEVEEVLEAFQDLSETIQTKLSFTVDDSNNEIVVKVFDKESNELIRQFPSEEMLALQDKMTDLAGFLFSENV